MPRDNRLVAVITADVIGSSRYSPKDRRRLDTILRAAFEETSRRFGDALQTSITFRITAGDEFQCVVRDVARVFDLLTYLRSVVATAALDPSVRFRAGIGVGHVSIGPRKNSYEQDGGAFVRARQALESLNNTRGVARTTMVRTGVEEQDNVADALLGLADYILAGWTVAQWEAVRWALLGHTRLAIARELNVAHQNVTKRLRAAGWPPVHEAFTLLGSHLSQVASSS